MLANDPQICLRLCILHSLPQRFPGARIQARIGIPCSETALGASSLLTFLAADAHATTSRRVETHVPPEAGGGAFFRHSQFGVRPAGHTQRRRPHLRVLQDEACREAQALVAQVRWFVARPMLEWDSVRAATGLDQVRRRDDVQAERDDVEKGNGEVHAAGESFHVVV